VAVSAKDLAGAVASDIHQELDDSGITVEMLAKQAKDELEANLTKIVKIKGGLDDDFLPEGYKVIGCSGTDATEGETIIESTEINWATRQKARQDMHKLRGDYPAEKHKIELDERSLNALLRGLPAEFCEAVRAELEATLLKRRN
jgi:hypothetical protein